MGVSDIIARVRAAGAEIAITGDRLSISRASNLPPGLLDEIRADKPALMAALRSPPACPEPAPDETDETLGLGLDGEHRAILEAAMRRRPNDVRDAQWEVAIGGLRAFLRDGHGAEAERLGWPPDELYHVPELWSQIHLTGAALLIGDREVTAVTADKIQIKSESGSILSFYRRPQPEYGLVYRERLKALRGLGDDEAHFRAFDHAVSFCRQHSGCDLEQAKALVRAAIAKPAAQ
jgi:hypothetical protein